MTTSEEEYIRIKAVMEVVGKPKEYIEQKIREYIDNIRQDNNLVMMSENIAEATEQAKVWSIFAEVEVVIKGISNLVGFCIDYMPSSIEVIKPEKFSFEERIFTNFINDMIAKLHNVDMIAKRMGTENNFLRENMNRLISNNLLILAKFGVNTKAGMSKANGVSEDELKPFLEKLVQEKRMKEENNAYFVI